MNKKKYITLHIPSVFIFNESMIFAKQSTFNDVKNSVEKIMKEIRKESAYKYHMNF